MEARERLAKIDILNTAQFNLRVVSERFNHQSCVGVNGHARHRRRTIESPQRSGLTDVRMPAADEGATTIPTSDCRELPQQAGGFLLDMLARWRLLLTRRSADRAAEEVEIERIPLRASV